MTEHTAWVLFCGTLVFFMQAGFTCHEAGFVQSKNVIAVSIENLLTFMITVVMFIFVGMPLMYNINVLDTAGFGANESEAAFIFLQIMFAAVSVTIFAGAMSERTKLSALLIASVASAGLIYPVFGGWAWGSGIGPAGGWLAKLGYMDFAGASVVHLTAGAITLAGLLIAGRRKELKKGKSNIPLATLGVFILWFGWLGFNGGRADSSDSAALIFLNTTIAAAFGMMGALISNLLYKRKGRYLISIFNGVLGGLVSVTAVSGYCGMTGAMAAGLIAGVAADCSQVLLERLGIDDVVNAVPVHLTGGLTGILLLPFIVGNDQLACGNRIEQLGVQFLGAAVDFAWAFGLAYLIFKIIDKTIGIRVAADEESKGLNIVEFNDIYSWESYMEISSYESEINDKNKLLRKQTEMLTETEAIERDKLARELHDGLGQSLATLKLVLKMGAGGSGGEDKNESSEEDKNDPQKNSLTQKALALAENSLTEMRNVLNDLSPEGLQNGLAAGLRAMAASLSQIDGFECSLEGAEAIPDFDSTETLNIYRLIQEALTNVVKHSGADRAAVVFRNGEEGLCIDVTDNGRGFDAKGESHSQRPADNGFVGSRGKKFGLSSMEERAKMMGGQITVISEKGRGTTVRITVPVKDE